MNTIELRAEPRSVLGKKVRALRRQGFVPANVYGHAASTAIQVPAREAEQVLHRAGKTHLVALTVADAEPTTVLLKAWQRHPYRGDLLHLDFYRVAMTEQLRVDVPVRLVGEAPAVKTHGGTVFQALATVAVSCLPGDIPEAIEADISGLDQIDGSVYVRDLTAPPGVTIETDADEVIVKVLAPTVEPEVEAPAAEAEAEAPAAAEEAPTEATEES